MSAGYTLVEKIVDTFAILYRLVHLKHVVYLFIDYCIFSQRRIPA